MKLYEVEKNNGSLFLNNKTQSIRLKKKVRFENFPKKLVSFNFFSHDSHIIFIMEEEHELSFIKFFESASLKDITNILPGYSEEKNGKTEWQKFFSDRKEVSVFLNNTTQSVRIPSSFAFRNEDVKEANIIQYQIGDIGKVLAISQ